MPDSVVVRFVDRRALERDYAENLAHGRAFVPDVSGFALFSPVLLVLEHPDTLATLQIEAEVVMVMDQGAMRGIALQFKQRSEPDLAALAAFVGEPTLASESESEGDGELVDAGEHPGETYPEDEDEDGDPETPKSLVSERQLRLRNLSLTDRLKVARGPSMDDRVQLERIYGAAVWEPLLRNPKITVPEVARIAKKGTIPRPLIDLICENEAWVRQSVVRRALLTNPRLSPESALKVLRTMSTRELKIVPQQVAYPATVRAAATRLMRSG